MNIAIVGFATEGVVSARYFAGKEHEVTVCDRNSDLDVPSQYNTQLGESYLDKLDRFDVIVRSAGISPRVILEQNPTVEPNITTAVNEFLAHCPTKNTIGITGTKGKGTTSTLTAKILEAAGKTVWLGGNIGRSPLEFIGDIQPDDWVVLELSSFQLSDIAQAPHIAACLMVVPEHLDWHQDLPDYTRAKKRLFQHQTAADYSIYYSENALSEEIASTSPAQKIPYYRSPGAHIQNSAITIDGHAICQTDELKLLGKHNWQNVCAAVTIAWQAGVRDTVVLRDVLRSFTGLPHRIEFIREVQGVRYYNDSFATGLHATMAAIDAVSGKKVAMLGGYDRMLPLEHFADFAQARHEHFRTLFLYGASGPRLAKVLEDHGFTNYHLDTTSRTMPEIVAGARKIAQHGDAVVFSPGFASFDMFKNFEERGNLFRETVMDL